MHHPLLTIRPDPARLGAAVPRSIVPWLLLAALLGGCNKADGKAGTSADKTSGHGPGDGHDHAAAGEPEGEPVDEVVLPGESVERYGVKVEEARLWVLTTTIHAPARVGFNMEAMAHVGSPLRGRIVEVKVRVGDKVRAGQELLIIESPELGEAQADYLQRRVAVQTAGPTMELARVSWERAKGLHEQSQGVSLTEVQRREVEHKTVVAALKAAEAAVAAGANRLHLLGMTDEQVEKLAATSEVMPRHSIKAAIDGVVVQREVTLGELVGPDRDVLMVIADATKLWVLADVPEAALMSVAPGAKAWIRVGSLSKEGGKRFEGSVAFISPMVDPTTRTAQVRIEVPVTELSLRPGMFAQAEIVTANPDEPAPAAIVAVPEEAIQSVEGGPALFVPVAGEPNTFQKRSVTIGTTVGGLVPVHSGLVEGELFVASGTFILKSELGKATAKHEH